MKKLLTGIRKNAMLIHTYIHTYIHATGRRAYIANFLNKKRGGIAI